MRIARLTTLFCLFIAMSQVASAQETIHISTGEYLPWASESLKHGGFTNHVISEAFKLEGYDVKFTFYPWKRAFEAAKDGKDFQATSYWYPSEERAQSYHYSHALQIDRTVFFHLKDTPIPDWETLDDLKGKRIGATRAYTYTPEFWEAQESGRLNIQVGNSDEVNFNKLINGRIDLFPAELQLGRRLLNQLFGADVAATVAYHVKPLVAPTAHLLISKQLENGEDLAAEFNQGLAKLIESGRYAELQNDMFTGNYLQ